MQLQMILGQLGRDTNHPYSIGQTAFQIHENLRPREGALRDQAIEKSGKIPALNGFGTIEKRLQISAMPP